MTTRPTARQARTADLPGIADALTLAFDDDPVMRWLFGTGTTRPAKYLRPYFAHEGRRHLRHEHVFTLDGTAGAAFWDPPGHWKVGLGAIAQLAPLMLRGMRLRTVGALRGLARMEAAHDAHPPHYYLAALGTRPDRQGEGIGGALLEPVLGRCDTEGVGAYLESTKESNIPYYRRYGFEVVGEVQFPGGPMLWPMWREPRPPGSRE